MARVFALIVFLMPSVVLAVVNLDFGVTKTGPATVIAGNPITYEIVVWNGGPDAALATFHNQVDSRFLSFTQTAGPSINCLFPDVGRPGPLDCDVSLSAGESSTARLVVSSDPSLPAGSTITSGAFIHPNIVIANDPPGNNHSTTTAVVVTQADVAISQTAPAKVSAGANAVYLINITNNGPSDAQAVSLMDSLPATLQFATLTAISGPAPICTTPPVGSTGVVTCSIATLPAGVAASVQLAATVDPHSVIGTSISNTATVSTATTDPAAGNNSATSAIAVATGIPTVSPAALVALAAMLAVVATRAMRG
jgi:uncharacterized repeat protein (TIGR01451 family)